MWCPEKPRSHAPLFIRTLDGLKVTGMIKPIGSPPRLIEPRI